MTSCAAPAAHAGRTRRRPGRRDSGGALPVRWSVRYLDRPRMPAAGLRRPPSRSARTTWPLWGSSLRAPSVAGDLPPPHRQTGFPQPVATLLPPNRARQAYDPAARSLGRSAAPQQQHQPSLRAAASSSAEHGQIRRPIFVPRPGHTVCVPPGWDAASRLTTRPVLRRSSGAVARISGRWLLGWASRDGGAR